MCVPCLYPLFILLLYMCKDIVVSVGAMFVCFTCNVIFGKDVPKYKHVIMSMLDILFRSSFKSGVRYFLKIIPSNIFRMLNKNTLGIKSARPIRSSIVCKYVQPKTLISAEAKKLLIKNLFNYLNDIQ